MTAKTLLAAKRAGRGLRKSGWKSVLKNWELYIFVLPTMAYFIMFHYFPLYGLQIAFRDYTPSSGIWNSPWVGLEHLGRF